MAGAIKEKLAISVRTDPETRRELEATARAKGLSEAAAVRQAIGDWLERQHGDPEFLAQLREQMERDREVLEKIASKAKKAVTAGAR